MISVEELVDLLEEKDLLSEDLITGLRQKIAQSHIPSSTPPWNKPITAARLAKWLVDNGHLSRLLAQRLLARAQDLPEVSSTPPKPRPTVEAEPKLEEEDLGFAPLEGEKAAPRAPQRTPGLAEEPKVPSTPAGAGQPAEEPEPLPAADSPGSLLDQELSPGGIGGPAAAEPLDTLMDGAILDAEAAAGAPLDALTPRKKGLFSFLGGRRKFPEAGKRENVWDSPLLLIGGGTLLGLVILGGVLYWALTRRNADDMLLAAEDFYNKGSYTNAIDNYNRYLEAFPKHSRVGLARVHRGLAQMRQTTEARPPDWPRALEVTKDVLIKIASEQEFAAEARPELSALLPKIAEGLTGQARETPNTALVEQAREALALATNTNYVPTSSQLTTRLRDVEALLAVTEWEIARDEELDKATAAMLEAVSRGKTAEAYEIRNALLKRYPRLDDNDRLEEAVLAVSQAEQSAVEMVAQERGGTAEPKPPRGVLATVALANSDTDKAAPGAEGHVIFAVAEGVAYGLNAATGRVLWRRQIGFDASGKSLSFPPTPITNKADSDVVMVDARRNEVLRVEAHTGKTRWRHSLGERFDAHPVVTDDQLLVATRSGRLVLIDLKSGTSPAYLQLPQSLRVAPTVDAARSSVYQIAEHSNLFVLSLTDGLAKQVVYLGHEPGSITAPPVIVNRYLVVIENDEMEDGILRVLSLQAADEGPPVKLVQEIRLNGHVDTPPLVSGVRLLVVTDKGDIQVFGASATDVKAPLVPIAAGQAAGEGYLGEAEEAIRLVRFPLMLVSGQVWIADSQLTRYDIHVSRGRLEPKGIENEGSVSLQPLVAIGQSIFHVRHKLGLPGVLISAFEMEGSRLRWETHLAAPLVSEPMISADANLITAVTSAGAVFQMASAEMQEGSSVIDQPIAALSGAEVRQPLTDVVSLKDDLLAMATTSGPKQIPVFDGKEGRKRFNWLTLPDSLDCRPIAFANGLVAPCKSGQVLLLDPRSGRKLLEPFQPRLESGVQVGWRGPAVIDDNEFLLANARNKLYRIGIEGQPIPHLALLGELDLSESIASPIAVMGSVAYAVDAGDTLLAIELPDLTRGQMWPLSGRCVWGPEEVRDRVMLATDDDQLYCLKADQTLDWKIALPYGPLAGAPLAIGNGEYILAAASGVVWQVKAAVGEETAKIETAYPLATGPVRLGEQLLVGGHDGSLHKLDLRKVEQP